MGKTLYLETSSGISGDMFVAAMIDLGADPEALERALNSIPADGFMVEISSVKKSGIACCDFNVILDAAHENHDHDMAYLYGPAPVSSAAPQEEAHHCHCHEDEEAHHCHCHEDEEAPHCHCHEDEEAHHCHCHEDEEAHHCHCHEDEEAHHCHCHEEEEAHHCHCHEEEPHHHHEHHHHGRHLAEILDIIDATDMTDSAKALAGKMFHIVAEAESLAHHMPLEEVHFHEVGAIDSIVDIIAAAVTFDSLGITDVIIPCLTEGRGTVRCQHGVLPVPVPATMNIIEAYDMPLTIMEAKGEYVTPTGAAIAAAICTTHQLPKAFRIVRTGLGAGKRDYTERTNILRAYLIEGNAMEEGKDEIVKLETDIDDSTGEALGYTIDRLMQAGALDVHYSPVYMKKNRPAWELTVICKKSRMEELEDIIFKETTTIGIREFPSVMRSILRRNQKQVETPFGIAEVKEVALPGERRFYPEYESVKAIAEKEHLPFAEVYHLVKALAEQNE
ncbi:MAG: nickel pincer cofactor biosynthesis protein LarC [Dialister sp.]|nr:nickel pincer cofactor biosynthesis protein LarC [Dialister sp.]